MQPNGQNDYFDSSDPIRDYFSDKSEQEIEAFSTFVESITEEQMMEYLSSAFDIAFEQIKIIGPRIVDAVPDLDVTTKREMLDEIFEKQKWKFSREMILEDFLEGRNH